MTRRTTIAAAVTALTGAALLLAGQIHAAPARAPADAIKARQAGYKKMGAAMKQLMDQLKSDAPAKDAMLGAARTLAATSREQVSLFPVGSGPGGAVKTDALANIWTERPAFDAQMTKLVAETGKLATVAAGGDVDAIRAQAKATGAVCGACHRQFRADD